jgi:hypothetical protein
VEAPPFELIVHSWDIASTKGGGDWTVCAKFGLAKESDEPDILYLFGIVRMQVELPDVREPIIAHDSQASDHRFGRQRHWQRPLPGPLGQGIPAPFARRIHGKLGLREPQDPPAQRRPIQPLRRLGEPDTIGKISLFVLDWDVAQIEGALLETWLPAVFRSLEELSRLCRARRGSLGAFIEDKNSGTILLQQAWRRQLRAYAIDAKLTAMGKDERAISVSGYVHRELVK